jgi:hypothetical protein
MMDDYDGEILAASRAGLSDFESSREEIARFFTDTASPREPHYSVG